MMHGRNNGKKIKAVRPCHLPISVSPRDALIRSGVADYVLQNTIYCALMQSRSMRRDGVHIWFQVAEPALALTRLQAEIVRNTCEIIHLLTDSNPIQVIVDAIINRCGGRGHASAFAQARLRSIAVETGIFQSALLAYAAVVTSAQARVVLLAAT